MLNVHQRENKIYFPALSFILCWCVEVGSTVGSNTKNNHSFSLVFAMKAIICLWTILTYPVLLFLLCGLLPSWTAAVSSPPVSLLQNLLAFLSFRKKNRCQACQYIQKYYEMKTLLQCLLPTNIKMHY